MRKASRTQIALQVRMESATVECACRKGAEGRTAVEAPSQFTPLQEAAEGRSVSAFDAFLSN